jgi:predicted transcriptional regulator
MVNLRSTRESLSISQSKLARLAVVSRYKICMFELGGGSLTAQENRRIKTALEAEAARIRAAAVKIEIPDPEFGETN